MTRFTIPIIVSVGLIVTAVALKVAIGIAEKRDKSDQDRFERRWIWPLYVLLIGETVAFFFA